MHRYYRDVAEAVEETTATIMMPRFRSLSSADVEEKTPGEVVTTVDRAMERALGIALSKIAPHARIVGEEACESAPEMLQGLDRGDVWIVDPLDGTANFAAGRSHFGVIIAYASAGVTQAAWLFDPLNRRMCHAVLGGGAYIDDESIHTNRVHYTRPVVALATQFMPNQVRNSLIRRAEARFDVVAIPRCAAEHYPRLAMGQNHVALFQRTLPWDHAAGALFLSEAGGHVARWDGTPYVFHDGRRGILAASTSECWRVARDAFFLDEWELHEGVELLPQRLDNTLVNSNAVAKDS